MAELKIDGWRALHIRDWQGKPGLFTRNGHPIHGVDHILDKLHIMEQCAGEPMMFDGEFQVGGRLSATKQWCERGWKLGGEAGTLHLFDCMTDAEWRSGGSVTPLYQRKARLTELMRQADELPAAWEWRAGTHGRQPNEPLVAMIEDEWVGDSSEALALANRAWASGFEGLMLKAVQSGYERNRAGSWRKVKTSSYLHA